jgi:hypothetical protein
MFNEEVLRVCSVMILLQELPWLSQDDIFLCVRLYYEPFFPQKQKHFVRNVKGYIRFGNQIYSI